MQLFSGIRGTGKNIVTKHDLDISGRRNASNAMDKFSLDLDTGKQVRSTLFQYDCRIE